MAKEATIKCFTPKRVTLEELERLRAEDAARARAGLPLVGDGATTAPSTLPAPPATRPSPRRSGGQQPRQPGPARRDYSHLAREHEFTDLDDDQKVCPCCGLPFEPFPGTEDSTVIEIDVRAH